MYLSNRTTAMVSQIMSMMTTRVFLTVWLNLLAQKAMVRRMMQMRRAMQQANRKIAYLFI
jgi:hypothetical protein